MTTTKRTAKVVAPKAKATDALAIGTDETPRAYIVRMAAIGTREAIDAAKANLATRDDGARILTFEDRVTRGYDCGLLAVAETTLLTGTAPADFKAISKALDVDKDGGDFLGRRYSALREAWRLSVSHDDEAMASFTAAYREATGQNPERVREYVQWIDARSDSFRDAKVIANRITTATANAAKAKDEAKAKATATAKLVKAGAVTGCPITATQWAAMDEATLRDVAALATAKATALGVKRRADEAAKAKAAKANEAAAETGPVSAKAKRAPATVK